MRDILNFLKLVFLAYLAVSTVALFLIVAVMSIAAELGVRWTVAL